MSGSAVKVLVTELPADAYNEVKTALAANPVGPSGVTPQTIETAAGKAYFTVETGKDGANTVRRYSMMLSGGNVAFSPDGDRVAILNGASIEIFDLPKPLTPPNSSDN